MRGYFISFLVTHLVNFILSVCLLRKLIGKIFPLGTTVLCLIAAAGSVMAAQLVHTVLGANIAFVLLFSALLVLLGILKQQDIHWIKGLVSR
jgi:hypothetical protein